MEKLLYKGLTYIRYACNSIFHSAALLQHLLCRASASVAIAITGQNITAGFLILISLPGSLYLTGILQSIVGGTSVWHILKAASGKIISGCNQMGQNLASINPFPHKRIIRKDIILIPSQLGGHEIGKACFFHDLRHGRTVSKHIRQPEHFLLFRPQFFFKKTFSIENMADQRLAGCQIAVRLQPHSSFGLPAPLLYLFPDFPKQLRGLFPYKFIKLRLAGHKLILRILLHQVQNRLKAAHCLLPGLSQRPFPCHINMGMTDGMNRYPLAAADVRQVLFHILPHLFYRPEKFF